MLRAILLTLFSLPLGAPTAAQSEVCDELRPLLPDLRRIDRMEGRNHAHVVGDARVRVLEERLGEYLGLPPCLEAKLTTISGHRREVAKNGWITAWIHHRTTELGLGYAKISWSGEWVNVSGMHFRMADAEVQESPAHDDGPRHYSRSSLPLFYQQLGELMEVVGSLEGPIEGVTSFSGSPRAVPPFGTATVWVRRPCDLGEKYLSVRATLPLGDGAVVPEEGEPPAAVPPRVPFAGPAGGGVAVDRALNVGIELLDQLDFSFPHSIQLTHSRVAPLVYELNLHPYKKEHPPLPVRVHIQRGEDEQAWTVTGTKRRMAPEGVELATFVALMNRVVSLQLQRGERMGVLGLARGAAAGEARALFVTVDAESIWAAEKGQLYVLNVNAEGEAAVVGWDELPRITPGEPAMHVREAVSRTGKHFHLFVPVRGDLLIANPPPRVLRYGGLSFTPIGGNLSN